MTPELYGLTGTPVGGRAWRQRQQEYARTEVQWRGVCPQCGSASATYTQRQSEAQPRVWCGGCDR